VLKNGLRPRIITFDATKYIGHTSVADKSMSCPKCGRALTNSKVGAHGVSTIIGVTVCSGCNKDPKNCQCQPEK
jgi:hypothetical protein